MLKTWVRSLGCDDPLEKGKANHSNILAWRIPWPVYSSWGLKESDKTEWLSLSKLICNLNKHNKCYSLLVGWKLWGRIKKCLRDSVIRTWSWEEVAGTEDANLQKHSKIANNMTGRVVLLYLKGGDRREADLATGRREDWVLFWSYCVWGANMASMRNGSKAI